MITLFKIIMKLVLKIMESLFHLSQSISNIIKVLFIITNESVKKYGFYQTYKVLSYMRTVITHRTIISAITFGSVIKFNNKLNKDIVNDILHAISPYLQDCIKSKVSFILFYNIFYFSYILANIINFTLINSLNTLVILLTLSIGVVWNNVLSEIQFLNDWAEYILSTYSDLTGFNIPRPGYISESNSTIQDTIHDQPIEVNDVPVADQIINKNIKAASSVNPSSINLWPSDNVFYTIFIICGISIIALSLILADNSPMTHDMLHQIPKIDYILNPLNNGWYIITDYFTKPLPIPCKDDFGFFNLMTRNLYPNIDGNPINHCITYNRIHHIRQVPYDTGYWKLYDGIRAKHREEITEVELNDILRYFNNEV